VPEKVPSHDWPPLLDKIWLQQPSRWFWLKWTIPLENSRWHSTRSLHDTQKYRCCFSQHKGFTQSKGVPMLSSWLN
jgi:hypothetical protein